VMSNWVAVVENEEFACETTTIGAAEQDASQCSDPIPYLLG
jgi:hypothetical protein